MPSTQKWEHDDASFARTWELGDRYRCDPFQSVSSFVSFRQGCMTSS